MTTVLAEPWRLRIERMGPNELIEVPDIGVFNRNIDKFESAGFTREIMDKIFPKLEQQVMSILALFRLAASVDPAGTIVEIGSGKGGSMLTINAANPTADKHNIDPFEPYDETSAFGTVKGYKGFEYQQFKDTMDQFGVEVYTIRESSQTAHCNYDDNSIDMLFIDGNHSYKPCKDDILAWRPKVKVGGILCGHDYHPRFPGVIDAVKEIFGNGGYDVMPDSSIWLAME